MIKRIDIIISTNTYGTQCTKGICYTTDLYRNDSKQEN